MFLRVEISPGRRVLRITKASPARIKRPLFPPHPINDSITIGRRGRYSLRLTKCTAVRLVTAADVSNLRHAHFPSVYRCRFSLSLEMRRRPIDYRGRYPPNVGDAPLSIDYRGRYSPTSLKMHLSY